MQITVDGQDLYEITENEMDVLKYMLPSTTLDADCKRRLEWVLRHKLEKCYVSLKNYYMPILEADPEITVVPVDNEAFFNMVKVRPDYKDRDTRDAEQAAVDSAAPQAASR